ncbi:hypothetical protein LTR10_016489 [Elasticomyces elasticus]|uniref:Uncharacterized protein n=1 Tax=Exophiala sideris TaxID=1016849 RepID=A0ABR0IXN4_9EURO|nr:hypothetical protein LTR10_016489 [Elasticomyces elasticus]KAK5021995.1 hypothetical protein LTS07_010410 [Exophiala sideris]KAK5026337.1 hypothetical protein LTR13_010119 [Exophiala sideris]KAK5051127.1 hypothetical protein LTR69_010504 [Exophiala sideris]KAK5177230.1 hypothetical protein LTR44_010191 [Eurotiomycetes sp. CCFEE 6388]
MKIKMKGFSPGHAYLFTLILCLFVGLINAGPLRSASGHNDTSVAHTTHTSVPLTTVATTKPCIFGEQHDRPCAPHTPIVNTTLTAHKSSVTGPCSDGLVPTSKVAGTGIHYHNHSSFGHTLKKSHTTTSHRNGPLVTTKIPVTETLHHVSAGHTSVVSHKLLATGMTAPYPFLPHNHTGSGRPPFSHPTSGHHTPSHPFLPHNHTVAHRPAFGHPIPGHRPTGHPSAQDLSLESRDTEYKHDYALVCWGSQDYTKLCQQHENGYYCTSQGKVQHKGKESHFCATSCECIDLQPRPCIFKNVASTCLVSTSGSITDSNFQTIGNINDTAVDSGGTLNLDTTSTSLSTRDTEFMHTWAMVCGSDANRYSTSYCYQAPHSYYCSASGRLTTKGAGNKYCVSICRCVNLVTGTCIYGWAAAGVCAVGTDGTIFNSTLHIIGITSDATQLSNGTWVLPSLAERDIDIMSTSDEIASALAIRDSDVSEVHHNYALVCIDRERTNECIKITYSCNGNGQVVYKNHDALYSAYCKCSRVSQYVSPCLLGKHSHNFRCYVKDNIATLDNGTVIGNVSDATTMSNGTLDFTQALARRDDEVAHDYALVCLDRDFTDMCQKNGYYCSSAGKVTYTRYDIFCADSCECIKVPSRAKHCIITNFNSHPALVCDPNSKDVDNTNTTTVTISDGT